jgi:hypothetical protein
MFFRHSAYKMVHKMTRFLQCFALISLKGLHVIGASMAKRNTLCKPNLQLQQAPFPE